MNCPTYDALFEKWLLSSNDFIGTVRTSNALKKHFNNCPVCLQNAKAELRGADTFVQMGNMMYDEKIERISR